MFTTSNAIKVALIQVGVIVGGILAAGLGYRAAEEMGGTIPVSTVFLVHFGFWLLALPVAWIAVAVRLRHNAAASDSKKTLTFVVGLALLVVLTLFSLYAAGEPWMGGNLWHQDD
jgi:ABC-type Na+ efflux pump permease subunit